jgi:hypothetical protein
MVSPVRKTKTYSQKIIFKQKLLAIKDKEESSRIFHDELNEKLSQMQPMEL